MNMISSFVFNNLNTNTNTNISRKTKIKIKMCGFTREEDIKIAVNLNIDAIGLVFYPKSKRYVNTDLAKNLIAHIPQHIQIVGLFVNENIDAMASICQQIRIDLLQLHGDNNYENRTYCQQLHEQINKPYIKAIAIDNKINLTQLQQQYNHSHGFLLDNPCISYGGSGNSFNWQVITPAQWQQRKTPLILSGGINIDNIEQALALKPYAIDLSSGIEISPNHKGIKDAQKMQTIIGKI